MIRGLIFDLGNTLMFLDCDYGELQTRLMPGVMADLAARGAPVGETFVTDFVDTRETGRARAQATNIEYTAERALSDTLARHGVCYLPDDAIARIVENYFAGEQEFWRPYPDARETLERLKAQGLKLALYSNASDHRFIQRIASKGGVAEFFDPLLSSAGTGRRKPDPQAFQPILDAWQIPPNEIVMVGDAASYDILGAHRAGMRAILIEGRWDKPLVPHGEFSDKHLMQPDAAIRQLAELPDTLAALDKDRMNG